MFSHTDVNSGELGNSSSGISRSSSSYVYFQPRNSSQQSYQQNYASLFPYEGLDENFLRHLLNFTSANGETMHAILASNKTNLKHSEADNDTLNYETCSVTQDDNSAWFSTEFQAILHFMYITILLIAIFGNGIVCFIVCQSSRMQTVTNYFIANLALSDMLMAMFCIPFSFISLFVLQWVLIIMSTSN